MGGGHSEDQFSAPVYRYTAPSSGSEGLLHSQTIPLFSTTHQTAPNARHHNAFKLAI